MLAFAAKPCYLHGNKPLLQGNEAMPLTMNKERLLALIAIILAAAACRLLPHPANVTPIAAIALFAGAHFQRTSLAFAIPLLAMLASDAVIGFYSGMWVVYLAFAVIVAIGMLLRGHITPLPVAAATLASSGSFFLITNFAPIHHSGLYPHTLEGVLQSYTMALPFFTNTLLGDAFFVALLFGGFVLLERKYRPLQLQPIAA